MPEKENKRVVLTGASGGIGEHMANVLAERGYKLVLVARNKDKMEQMAEGIMKLPNASCNYFVCDLSKEDEIEKLISTYPKTDLLINNAGFSNYGFFNQSSWQVERDIIMVNVLALSRLCHHYLKGMLEQNYGRILNVASTAGISPAPFFSTYVGAKAFVIQFSKSLAIELQESNVSVSTLLPGPTATQFWEVANMASKTEKTIKYFDNPRAVAEFGITLMEKGKIAGIPGYKNKLKKIIKHFLPEKVWFFMVKQHMEHHSLHETKRGTPTTMD